MIPNLKHLQSIFLIYLSYFVRCGVGLLELVFAPDLRHGEEAAALAKELSLTLQAIQVRMG